MKFEPKCADHYNQILVFDEVLVNSNTINMVRTSDSFKKQKVVEIITKDKEKRCEYKSNVELGCEELVSSKKVKRKSMIFRHVIFPNFKQIYFVKNLHLHSHYSISSDNVFDFIQKSRNSTTIHELKFYSSYKSYRNDFIVLLNFGTKEWTQDINELHARIPYSSLPNVLEQYKTKRDDKRNNFQKSFGYSSQSYTRYSLQNCLPKPRLLKGTLDSSIIDLMESLSLLFLLLRNKQILDKEIFDNQRRNLQFSKLISSVNVFEGFTICLQHFDNCLGHHVDEKNCRTQDYSGVFGASSVIEGKQRIVVIGYGKNVALKYCEKLNSYKLCEGD